MENDWQYGCIPAFSLLVCAINGNVRDWSEVLVERKEWSACGNSRHMHDVAVDYKSMQIAGFFL
jgi:hypothetical protein